MKLKFWPFPVVRNERGSRTLNEVCDVLLDADWWRVEVNSVHDLRIVCPAGRVSFWNANKYYAWGTSGQVDLGSASFPWKYEMPSRWDVRQMAKRLAQEIARDMRANKEAQ